MAITAAEGTTLVYTHNPFRFAEWALEEDARAFLRMLYRRPIDPQHHHKAGIHAQFERHKMPSTGQLFDIYATLAHRLEAQGHVDLHILGSATFTVTLKHPEIMPDTSYQDRVREEKADLDARHAKLIAFGQSEAFHQLDPEDQALLKKQSLVMDEYSQILDARIERFDKQP